jgi:voltage-gated sodium channel
VRSGMRERVAWLVDARWFQHAVVAVILLNSVTLGLETYEERFADYAVHFMVAERLFVTLFVVELLLKIYARRAAFFRDPWSWFDLIVVGIALVPTAEGFSVLRLLRILRLLRLITVVPHMRQVVAALFRSVPGLGTVIGLLLIVLYTAAVLGEKLFSGIAPEYFGNLGITLFTLFTVLTTENWPDVAAAVMSEAPMAWIFFVLYIVVTAFIVLNLVIGVIVTSMEQEVSAERWEEDQELELVQHEAVMAQLDALTAQVTRLSEQVGALNGASGVSSGDGQDGAGEHETPAAGDNRP